MRKIQFAEGECYHVYNRGVDHRSITEDEFDSNRFVDSLLAFNAKSNIGSIYELQLANNGSIPISTDPLVKLVAYCLNPNHFHLILQEICEKGISLFMKRLGGGYSNYFNERHKRSGSLFQGQYKIKHIPANDYLLHASAYVNLNDMVHQLGYRVPKLIRSSADEYFGVSTARNICKKDIIMDQFEQSKDYELFAKDSLKLSLIRKKEDKDYGNFLMEV